MSRCIYPQIRRLSRDSPPPPGLVDWFQSRSQLLRAFGAMRCLIHVVVGADVLCTCEKILGYFRCVPSSRTPPCSGYAIHPHRAICSNAGVVAYPFSRRRGNGDFFLSILGCSHVGAACFVASILVLFVASLATSILLLCMGWRVGPVLRKDNVFAS